MIVYKKILLARWVETLIAPLVPPNIWVPHQRVGSDLGSFAELECLSAAHPASINFWSRDGDSYVVSKWGLNMHAKDKCIRHIQNSILIFICHYREGKYELTQISGKPSFYNVQMKIRISNVSEADFGLWRCLAKNSQGETSGEIKLYGMSMTHIWKSRDFSAPAICKALILQFTSVLYARMAILNLVCEISKRTKIVWIFVQVRVNTCKK